MAELAPLANSETPVWAAVSGRPILGILSLFFSEESYMPLTAP